MSVSRRVTVIGVVVISVIVATAVAMAIVEKIVPEEAARFPGHPKSTLWISLLAAAHMLGGSVGGCLVWAIGERNSWKEVAFVCVMLFFILGIPAISAFDRPVEMFWMLGFNVVAIGSLMCSIIAMRKMFQ